MTNVWQRDYRFSNSSEASFSDKIKDTNDVVIFALHMIWNTVSVEL